MHNSVNMSETTELSILNEWIVRYVNYISIKLLQKKKVTPFFTQGPHAQQEKNLMFGLHSYCAHEQRPLSHPALCLRDPLSLHNAE